MSATVRVVVEPEQCLEVPVQRVDWECPLVLHEDVMTGVGDRLHGRWWTPDFSKDPDCLGVVVIVHGLGDHCGRFASLAESLTALGWAVFAFDLPGHGSSPGSAGHIKSFQAILEDIHAVRQTAADRFAGLPQFLLGHSMGGNFALNYTLRRSMMDEPSVPIDGLALCAPMLLPPRPMPRPFIFAAWLTGHLIPWFRFNREVDVDALTGDSDQAKAIHEDPMMHSKISMYLATQLVSQGRWAIDHAANVDIPTLVTYGDDDELIDRGACQNLAIRMGANATVVTWPGMRHAIFHDSDHALVAQRIGQWLRQMKL